ncbi:MAG TPA: wax ester/triacylglycerol synthase family O-acyltransferase [Solirubrobacteraceae bacterium]|nr:wax ester/triacylglycerol synthase family O-acyltransferase [Solirubrobacteraceae bacterium]
MPPPDRLSALDCAFLDLETARAPLHVGWTLRFDGRPPSLAALRRHVDGRLDALPRFRRRVVRPALGLGDPYWADDDSFDVARHVHAVRAPAPGGAAELRELAGELLSHALDGERPLWRLYLVTGLERGGFAIVGQAHHALVDGVAAVEVALLLFDAAGVAPLRARDPAPTWTPERAPSAQAAGLLAATDRATLAARGARGLARAALRADPSTLLAARDALEALVAPAPATAFDRSATARRRVAFAETSLEGLREAGRRHGATVNDVLLAAATVALRRALRRRGERTRALKALVPVDIGEREQGALGNRISFVAVELPVGERDLVRVLRTVRGRTRAAKSGGEAALGAGLAQAAELLPAAGRRAVARAAARAASFNAVVSNVPGPSVALELLGRPLLAAYPAVPLLDGHALAIGALSYGGRLHAGILADAEIVPDAVEIARDLEQALDALRVVPAPPLSPWRARARERRVTARAGGGRHAA